MNNEVIVLIGSGEIGVAIARRVGVNKTVLLADLKTDNARKQAETLTAAGFKTAVSQCDVSNGDSVRALAGYAQTLGAVKGVIHTAGVSPSLADPQTVLKVDLYGTALVFDVFGEIIAEGGSAVVIGSQSAHRLPALTQEQNRALALTPADKLLDLDFVKEINDTLLAYQTAKRGNALRVAAQALEWAKRGARINCISAGIVHTPLANAELNGERKEFYQTMLKNLPVGRGGTPDDIANLAELLMSERGAYITGSDFLIDGGATAQFWWQEK